MKSLFKTTAETPKTSTWVLIVLLLTSVSDFIFSLSSFIGMGKNTVGVIGASISFAVTIINILINNGKMKVLTTESVGGFLKDVLDNVVGVFRGTKY